LLPQRASLKRASKAAVPNFVLWVEIKILYLAHCMTVPVNFNRGAARSGIRQTRNVIIFHLWSSFMESHSWLKSDQTAFCWVLLALYGGAFGIIRGAFAIIRSGSSIIRGAFNIIRDHRCFHSTLFPYSFHDMYMI
jgi:hypothetical protein